MKDGKHLTFPRIYKIFYLRHN